MQICTSLQTDNHASTPPLSFYSLDAFPTNQPTVSKHWRPDRQMYKSTCSYLVSGVSKDKDGKKKKRDKVAEAEPPKKKKKKPTG